jgi:hypothetical protein
MVTAWTTARFSLKLRIYILRREHRQYSTAKPGLIMYNMRAFDA